VYRSLELAPARLNVATLDDPGCNLSAWNLTQHDLSKGPDGVLVDGRWPLRLMVLDGFDPGRPYRINGWASRVRLSQHPVLTSLCEGYADELLAAGFADFAWHLDIGQRLANGLVVDDSLRSLFAVAHAQGLEFPDPTSPEGTNDFVEWLRGPAARGGAHGVNRYVFFRVLRQRPDVVDAFPDLDGSDGPGLVAWCHSSGQTEMGLPDELMPVAWADQQHPGDHGRVAAGPSSSSASRAEAELAGLLSAAAPSGLTPTLGEEDVSLGVRVSGYLGHVLGLGAAARGYALALGAAGVPLSTVSFSLDHLRPPVELAPDYGRHLYDDLAGGGRHSFDLICINPDELPGFVSRLGPGYFTGTRIGVWAWETNSIPSRWASAFELVDEIWVYSRFVAENIGAVTEVPVVALPPPVQPAAAAHPIRLGLPDGFLFLFVFDYSSTIQRKNPVALIGAFKRAFSPAEGPRLLIKTIGAPLFPLADEEVLWAARGRPDIHVIDQSLTSAEMDGLMAACDCYVSLHRSEGFGLTMAEAMSLGKPVIGTAYSGNVDFMNPGNSFLVDFELTRVGPDCLIYPADGEWAEPSVEHAAELMRRVYDDRQAASRIGAQARLDIARDLSPETTGGAMRRRLKTLARAQVGLRRQ
jgi:glycosyltransferase involved in cell wall biosynthesis